MGTPSALSLCAQHPMLNTLISQKANAWFQREDCPARQVVAHIQSVDFLQDAQIEAIKTYLFLKIAGGNLRASSY